MIVLSFLISIILFDWFFKCVLLLADSDKHRIDGIEITKKYFLFPYFRLDYHFCEQRVTVIISIYNNE